MRETGRKKHALKTFLTAAALFWGTGTGLQGGAWSQEEGKGLVILQYFFYTTDSGFNNDWQLEEFGNGGRFTKNELNLYAEYGILDRLTIFSNLFLDYLVNESNSGEEKNFGVADPEFGARYQFAEKIPQALQLIVKVPGPYDVNDVPALGNGQTDVELAYFIGSPFTFFGNNGFVDAGVGYRLRTSEPADEFRWYFVTGLPLSQKLDILIENSGIIGLGDAKPQIIGDNILLTTDFSLIKVGVSALYRTSSNWAIQAGPYLHVAGRATGAGGGFKIAIWRKF